MQHLLNPLTSTPTYQQMTNEFDFTNHSHRRFNPLSNTYVLCSPHRAKRPWQGAREEIKKVALPNYDPKCYLCPGNVRATGDVNPKFEATFVFPNDYPAVKLDQPNYVEEESKDSLKGKLLKTQGVKGKCFVICFSPNHSLTLPVMSIPEITNVVEAWTSLYNSLQREALSGNAPYKYLQIFENKGFAMGCSNPHPHGQAWCLDVVPTEVDNELQNMQKYHQENLTHMLGDYVKLELQEKERIVVENDSFIVVVPYWALWPFETLLIAKEHLRSTQDFTEKHKQDLAEVLKVLTTKYDNLFNTSFPYSMGIHQAPLQCSEHEKDASWFHMHFYPPLLRSATVKKFCVGFEMLGEPQRDLTSEQAAARLQELSGDFHFSRN
ncbi:galactose-1-phosphate uridyl transferase [Scheffersomyces stipitis CBS 6054]|uniref:Galactose-1-phosphate uridylyltransferase n=1 Tax=Scheffersomyces stipitis (strain ATCC 58785 / CBS 6054 / NBRC 10063 / NRRL Y-11545) TaxID=322104 RepID=A3LR66_PICST|nr:galactose-1-phosphate uridyl transferase [Scheffersomyces stipitis CBS 6054]ABN65330.2 galactose-1-phosphate uridyl transferase [Scheffersomyces stipitis CBS 6054]